MKQIESRLFSIAIVVAGFFAAYYINSMDKKVDEIYSMLKEMNHKVELNTLAHARTEGERKSISQELVGIKSRILQIELVLKENPVNR